ncbi:MAG: Na/Pi cotransporter family protein [Clostridia bacterium]|jgi:phosphate:Na+ symporter|nr:Na/Pi cotransporter family protein [Clostridia bacterium]
MTVFDVLQFFGGVAMLLFGMRLMSDMLEKKAGGVLSGLLSKFTDNKLRGCAFGALLTAVVQSSSAMTVMVVGLVNGAVLTLSQAIPLIIGANVGTTATVWLLSLTGMQSDLVFLQFLKPTAFVPVLALVGVVLLLFVRDQRKKDIGTILLSFSVLMYGMIFAADALAPLGDMEEVKRIFLALENPALGLLAGLALTALLQSSAAGLGILQALSLTGHLSFAAAVPIILGQHIGTCVTALLSCIGAGKNAKRTALSHLLFNIFGAVINLTLWYVFRLFMPGVAEQSINAVWIAILHTGFMVITAAVMLPLSGVLEKLVCKLVKDGPETQEVPATALDTRLFINPSLALVQAKNAAQRMARESEIAFSLAIDQFHVFDRDAADQIEQTEQALDVLEDEIDTYLLKLSSRPLSQKDSSLLGLLQQMTVNFERLSDHAVHVRDCASLLNTEKGTPVKAHIDALLRAAKAVVQMTTEAFCNEDINTASDVEPLEQVIDQLSDRFKQSLTEGMRDGTLGLTAGTAGRETVSYIERVSDHCSSIAAALIEARRGMLDMHEYVQDVKENSPVFREKVEAFAKLYQA